MSKAREIEVVKRDHDDALAFRVLKEWFAQSQPKWKRPMDWCVASFFIAMTLWSVLQEPMPSYTWAVIVGMLVSVNLAIWYVPFLAKMALTQSKRQPSYYKEKTYRFFKSYLIYGYEGSNPIEIPLAKFTSVRVLPDAIMLNVKGKLSLWFPTADLCKEDTQEIIARLEKCRVRIDRS